MGSGQWAVGSTLACCTAGQHLLSAACDEVAGADTVSWELHPRPAGDEGSDSVCVDLAIPHLSSEQLQVNTIMLGTTFSTIFAYGVVLMPCRK